MSLDEPEEVGRVYAALGIVRCLLSLVDGTGTNRVAKRLRSVHATQLMQRLLLVLCLFAAGFAASAQLSISNPRCEYRTEPMGIDTLQPHLSWTLESTNLAARGLRQSAYQILVATERDRLQVDQADLWDSGKV